MLFLDAFWRWLTNTAALNQISGGADRVFFEQVYRVLYLTGFSSYDKGIGYMLYSNTVKLIIALFICSEIWYLYTAFSSIDTVVENISVTLIHLLAVYRYIDMIQNKQIFANLATAMESPLFDVSTPNRKELVNFWLQRSLSYLCLLLFLGTCALAAWYVYPLVDDLEYNLCVAVRLPFDYRTPLRYPIVYMVVVVAFNYTSYFVMVNDVIMQSYLMHLICQYTVLADCFENIINDCEAECGGRVSRSKLYYNKKFTDIYLNRLHNLSEQHKLILNNTMRLRTVLSTPMLGQLGASSVLICFAGYQVSTSVSISITKLMMSLFYLGYNMFELSIFCRWCDEIKTQSENICQSIYFSGWELGLVTVPGVKRRLMLIVERARRPMVLTAGGIYELSLVSYTAIVKVSYSALTVLLRLR